MGNPVSYRAALAEYQQEADVLLTALKAGDSDADWRFKWEHPRFRGKTVDAVKGAALDLDDALLVVAHQHAFDTWADLVAFTTDVARDGPTSRFEAAVEAVVSGDLAGLASMLREHPDLVRARSTRRHHATLLHYIAANGVEGDRQTTPANAVAVTKELLDAGAEVDALADMYDEKCTTMSMLVSSCHPANAGLQGALAETLLDAGAALEGPGSNWQSALVTALAFGYADTAKVLARRGARINFVAAAGLGRLEEARQLLPQADRVSRHAALALAAQHGRTDVVQMLLDAGEDPSRYNPPGFHDHSTPLHQAVWANQRAVVALLVERGARLDIKDTVHQATPLGWATYGGRTEIAELLRARGAPTG